MRHMCCLFLYDWEFVCFVWATTGQLHISSLLVESILWCNQIWIFKECENKGFCMVRPSGPRRGGPFGAPRDRPKPFHTHCKVHTNLLVSCFYFLNFNSKVFGLLLNIVHHFTSVQNVTHILCVNIWSCIQLYWTVAENYEIMIKILQNQMKGFRLNDIIW